MRVLFVTPLRPGPEDPDFGSLLVPIVRELRSLGHELDVVAIDRRAGGVDLDSFAPRPRGEDPSPHFLCIGSWTARKNVVALADAFARLGEGRLTFLGDERSAERSRTPRRPRRRARPTRRGPQLDRASRCHLPASLTEAFGQALLEAMAMERSVVATIHGGPAEFVTPDAGVLVDPTDPDALLLALSDAARLGTPQPAARTAAAKHDVRIQATRMADVLTAALAR